MQYPQVISAVYNQKDPKGVLIPWMITSATEIAMWLLRIMDEPSYEVRLPHAYPACGWAYEPAGDALAQVAAACGCVVVRRGDGVLVVAPEGY